MKVNVKKDLCVLNTVLSFIGYLLLHATLWLLRSYINAPWIFLDSSSHVLLFSLLPPCLAFWSIFWDPKKSKARYIIIAVMQAAPAIVFTVILSVGAPRTAEELSTTWRMIPAIILYFAVSVLYFVMAFTKNKEPKKGTEPIPYSD